MPGADCTNGRRGLKLSFSVDGSGWVWILNVVTNPAHLIGPQIERTVLGVSSSRPLAFTDRTFRRWRSKRLTRLTIPGSSQSGV